MEWVARLRGATVGVDTAPLIYFIERHPVLRPKLRPFFEAADRREFRLVTSVVTLIFDRSSHFAATHGAS